MRIDFEKIYNKTYEHYTKAKNNIEGKNILLEGTYDAISDVIPGFDADKLEFGSFDSEKFAVLFVDMRGSTNRAKTVGAEKTFLTMHVFLTALLEVVKYYNGKVIDIMGDGLMVFWGGKISREKEGISKVTAIKSSGLCGHNMLLVCEKVINKIIKEENLGAPINIGVGVTFGRVIVTKIGIKESYDVKAFGDCINTASKYASKAKNEVKVSKKIRDEWPKGKGGKIKFEQSGDDGFILKYKGE